MTGGGKEGTAGGKTDGMPKLPARLSEVSGSGETWEEDRLRRNGIPDRADTGTFQAGDEATAPARAKNSAGVVK